MGRGFGHPVAPVEIGLIAGSETPGTTDSHLAVALVCIMVGVIGGKRLPAMEAQGVPWQEGDERHLGAGTMPGTLGEMISQEPQSNGEVDVFSPHEKTAVPRSQGVCPRLHRGTGT